MKKYNYLDCKPASIRFNSNVHLFPTKDENDIHNQKEYANIIGSLRYAIDCTRPDIADAVGVLAKFTSKPNFEHWNAMTQLMGYLKRTVHYGLLYQRYPAVFEGYSDVSWNTLLGDSLSTTSYVFTIGGGAISWKSKKQQIIAKSTMEAELIALSSASEEAGWLRDLSSENFHVGETYFTRLNSL